MSDTAPDQSRGPDGRFAAPTPDLPDAAAPASPAPEAPAATTDAASPAPDLTAKGEARAIFERITGQRAAATDGAGTADARPPAERETTAAPASAEVAAKTTPDAKSAADAPAYAEYAGSLDRRTGDLLKGVNQLLPPGTWAAMSRYEQDEHVAVAKELRKQAQAAALSDRQAKPAQPPAAAPQAQPPQQRAPQANTGQTQLDASARGESVPSGQQSAVQLPPQVQAQLDEYAKVWGADSAEYQSQRNLVESVFASVQNVQTASSQAFQQHQDAIAKEHAAIQKRQEDQADRQFEDSVLATYLDAAPSLKDPKRVEEIRATARATMRAHISLGHEVDPADVVRKTVLAAVGSEIQQHQAKQQQKRREQSLSGSVQRGQPNTGKPPALTERERYRAAWDKAHAVQQ